MIFVNHVSVFVRFFFPLLQNHDFPLQDYHPRKYQQWYSKKPFQSWLGQYSTVSTRHWSQIHLTNFPWDISKVDLFSLASHHQRNWGDNMLDGTIYVEETPMWSAQPLGSPSTHFIPYSITFWGSLLGFSWSGHINSILVSWFQHENLLFLPQ